MIFTLQSIITLCYANQTIHFCDLCPYRHPLAFEFSTDSPLHKHARALHCLVGACVYVVYFCGPGLARPIPFFGCCIVLFFSSLAAFGVGKRRKRLGRCQKASRERYETHFRFCPPLKTRRKTQTCSKSSQPRSIQYTQHVLTAPTTQLCARVRLWRRMWVPRNFSVWVVVVVMCTHIGFHLSG